MKIVHRLVTRGLATLQDGPTPNLAEEHLPYDNECTYKLATVQAHWQRQNIEPRAYAVGKAIYLSLKAKLLAASLATQPDNVAFTVGHPDSTPHFLGVPVYFDPHAFPHSVYALTGLEALSPTP